ncbi:nucleotide excision repair factor TFIIH/TFIIK subunit cyclin H-like protein [Encephalitozoon intestinalis ATCC 50506]|uniref:Nucleotide excision repair factor TFIIH/TFIIK subunit cyclin H-like protein n=1 Tax=Encephalitozoon intestinalis (strain ATCC 50506) TaxID=876142 RepID=E0S971_ENCIT|nr:nucleotide excision repair factor TFIIH/TFIIK subunit cyclin H-like protein [Encephalitozoon intestinalis ATCC 50506]ADM12314.2 nucleotide excision repair factor TFIIH/TFIIK subunit cyclin H-like protein [Encephalitozoon intestinalis ATCC 50506]UTX46126.1 cyclin H [Encephalitozoon intestinalis]
MENSVERIIGYRWEIIEACIKLDLPVTVRSTSIQIFDRAIGKMLRGKKEMRDVIYAIVIVASKCEDLHGNIDTLIKRLPGSNKKNIFNYESELFEVLDYNFHFPSLYLRMYGVLALLQEKGLIKVARDTPEATEGDKGEEIFVYSGEDCIVPCINKLWKLSVERMDKILILGREPYKEIELVYASLYFPCEMFGFLSFSFSKDNVIRLRNACESFRPPETK